MEPFSTRLLDLDCPAAVETITQSIRSALSSRLNRRGLIVAISGGIDSSVTLALSVRAVGAERVRALQMPERESSPETLGLSGRLAAHFGVQTYLEDITGTLEAVGFYRRYAEAVRLALPEYGPGWKSKIVLPDLFGNRGFNLYSVVAQSPAGETVKKRLPLEAVLGMVAATNFKQRIRKMFEYYYADKLNFAVTGTPNRLEYDQGFFVKLGDGAADLKPIAHLYKTQVYRLAEYLGVPEEIRRRPPTTDTYSLPQGQDEFYFSLAYPEMDLCLLGKNRGYPPEAVAPSVGLTPEQVARVYRDIETKRRTTRYLQAWPVLIQEIAEISHSG